VSGEREIAVNLNGFEGTIFTFIDSGCSDYSHINTVHQMLLKFKKSLGFELKKVIIEAKYGDVVYCRLNWAHEKTDIYNVCSLGDALIFANLTMCDLFITKNTLDQFENFDEDVLFESYEDS
jgi:hypothetical protein